LLTWPIDTRAVVTGKSGRQKHACQSDKQTENAIAVTERLMKSTAR